MIWKRNLYKKTQTEGMDLNFQIKEFTGTEHFQSELKILDTITECYTGNFILINDLTNARQVLPSLKCEARKRRQNHIGPDWS